jgi:hypothetical protein
LAMSSEEPPRPAPGSEIVAEAMNLEQDSGNREWGHKLASDFWMKVHLGLGLPSIALAAIAGTSALAEFDNSNLIAGLLALAVAVLSALATWLNPNRTAELHRRASARYHSICRRARQLHRIDPYAGRSLDDLRLTLYELAAEFDEQVASSPALPRRYTGVHEEVTAADVARRGLFIPPG